ncbi:MAG TPA: fibronectin type III domain-containing protein [Gaiellaceae bacterium]|nr:fibronectin type III domain-containing protein [Gaiellaceae bacterium]
MSVLPARRAVAGLTVLAAFALLATSATAALDSKPPTKPGNLRATAKTLTSVSMAWNASTDNSGNFSYRVRLWGDPTVVTLPRTQTSYTWTGLRPGVQYYFWVEAVDGSGNKSTSDLLVVETLRDTTAPSAPGNLRVESVTASQISLSWDASTDDSGIIDLYQVTVSPAAGNVVFTGATSATVGGLAPETAYTLTVRARDAGWNFSQPSNAVSATTEASSDTTPPSAPTGLQIGRSHSCEIDVRWTQSTDDQDPQSAIRYELFDNGVLDPNFSFVIGTDRWISYGFEGTNTWVLYAVDSAGNRSAPSNSVTRELSGDDCQ